MWLWPNLLGLDAPLIALVWQGFLAQCFDVPLRPAGRAALFLTVWAIYVADRLLDVRVPAPRTESARHAFSRRHRTFALLLLAVLLSADVPVTVLWLRPAVLVNGFVPFAAVLLYLAVLNVTGSRFRVAKEPVVAFLFAAGTFLVAWTNDANSPITLLLPAVAFFLLCLANLAAIERWEWIELREGREPPHVAIRGLVRKAQLWIPLLAVGAATLGSGAWYRAIGLSAGGAAALVIAGRRLPIELRRVLVDAALLAPLLWLLDVSFYSKQF